MPFVFYYLMLAVLGSVIQFFAVSLKHIVCGISIIWNLNSHIQYFPLNVAGEKFTERVRVKLFGAILRQEISWFDKPENSVGALTTILSVDPTEINKICINYDMGM